MRSHAGLWITRPVSPAGPHDGFRGLTTAAPPGACRLQVSDGGAGATAVAPAEGSEALKDRAQPGGGQAEAGGDGVSMQPGGVDSPGAGLIEEDEDEEGYGMEGSSGSSLSKVRWGGRTRDVPWFHSLLELQRLKDEEKESRKKRRGSLDFSSCVFAVVSTNLCADRRRHRTRFGRGRVTVTWVWTRLQQA